MDQDPPPGMLAAAEQGYHAVRDRLDQLVNRIRERLHDGQNEVKVCAALAAQLRTSSLVECSTLAAAAIVRLAQLPSPRAGGGRAEH